jgi:hypothetical protein
VEHDAEAALSPLGMTRDVDTVSSSIHRGPAVGQLWQGRDVERAENVDRLPRPQFPHHEDGDEMRRLEMNIIVPQEVRRP